jgi:hypothetical protein
VARNSHSQTTRAFIISAITLTKSEYLVLSRRASSRKECAEGARCARRTLLLSEGYTWDDIQTRLNCSRGFIHTWRKRFGEGRLAGLYSRYQGQKPVLPRLSRWPGFWRRLAKRRSMVARRVTKFALGSIVPIPLANVLLRSAAEAQPCSRQAACGASNCKYTEDSLKPGEIVQQLQVLRRQRRQGALHHTWRQVGLRDGLVLLLGGGLALNSR